MDRLEKLLTSAGLDPLAPYLLWILVGIGALMVFVILKLIFGGRSRKWVVEPTELDLTENLAGYPPAPSAVGQRRLMVDGIPMRLRLVVVAPVGQGSDVNADAVGPLLDQIVRGLGIMVAEDKPRIRIWPAPLSNRGFAPTFHRNVVKPEPDGQLSRWVLVAGQAKAGRWPLLIGLAFWADQPTPLGRITIEAHQWRDTLRFQEN